MKRGISLLASILLSVVTVLALGSSVGLTASAAHPSQTSAPVEQSDSIVGPLVSQALKSDVSPALGSLPIIQSGPAQGAARELPRLPIPGNERAGAGGVDRVLQKITSPFVMPTPIVNVDGMINYWGNNPPDTIGDVGPNHYVQMVNNTGVLILNKAGARVGGPYNFYELFQGFGGLCETRVGIDPVVIHDQLADRWFLSHFVFQSANGPTYQCIALSTSSDPLGSYYRYAFQTALDGVDDYPKYGVWPDAYYLSANRFRGGNFTSGVVGAFERQRMIEGDPGARQVIFVNPNMSRHLPSDLDGGILPPPGSPNYYLVPTNPESGTIDEYKLHVDWSDPSLSTFTGPFPIMVAPWDPDLCPAPGEICIPQPNPGSTLRALSEYFMYRLAYRNFGTHESLVINHTVDADGTGRAGIRWYEIRDPNGSRTVHQQGTFGPADGHHRFMGSVAMDRQGNMAAGYSVSSSTLYPSIRYAGRLVSDPLNEFTQGEASLIEGSGSQTWSAGRWGDYSSINIDPRDDCTFWYTTEYYSITGQVNWRTRIGSFKFPGCAGGTATPVPTSTGTPPTQTSTPMPSPTSCPGGISTTGSITSSDPTQVGAPFPGQRSSCGTAATCIAQVGSEPFHYDSYTLTNNSGASQCITVRIDASVCQDAGLISAAYLGSFNPNSVCSNYLGSPPYYGPRYSYSFTVPAGATYVVVVRELSHGIGCATYNIDVNPCGPPATATSGPATSTATMTAIPTMTALPTLSATPTLTAVPTLTATPTFTLVPTLTAVPTSGTSTATHTAVVSSPTATVARPSPTTTACAITFGDVPQGHTFYAEIRCLACRGIVSGYADGTFRPDNLVTRGQLAKIVSNAANFQEAPGAQIFQDVPVEHTFYEWINRLTNRGHMSGYTCGSPGEPCVNNRPYFRPFANATRAQTSKIVSNAARFAEPPTGQTFEDVPSSHPFYEWIQRLASRSIMGGYNCGGAGEPCGPENRPYFRPYNDVTRGQSAKIVANTFYPNCQTP